MWRRHLDACDAKGVTLITNDYLRFDGAPYVDPESGLVRFTNGIGYYDSVAGTVVFGSGGEGCTVEGDGEVAAWRRAVRRWSA